MPFEPIEKEKEEKKDCGAIAKEAHEKNVKDRNKPKKEEDK
jgi:hypothetical protein